MNSAANRLGVGELHLGRGLEKDLGARHLGDLEHLAVIEALPDMRQFLSDEEVDRLGRIRNRRVNGAKPRPSRCDIPGPLRSVRAARLRAADSP
jgi:hypothetical protein